MLVLRHGAVPVQAYRPEAAVRHHIHRRDPHRFSILPPHAAAPLQAQEQEAHHTRVEATTPPQEAQDHLPLHQDLTAQAHPHPHLHPAHLPHQAEAEEGDNNNC